MNPTITTVEELCAMMGVHIEQVKKSEIEHAKYLIERNRLRLQVTFKQQLYKSKNQKDRELLYKLMANGEELQNLGINTKEVNVNSTPTIEIKCADPDIISKIKAL